MKINSKIKNYSVEMIDNLLERKDKIFSSLRYRRLFYLVDENFFSIYEKKIKEFIGEDFFYVIPATEQNKSYFKLADYYRVLVGNNFMRSDILVTFGGGILQDISGFIASTLYRGIKWIFFPTTLLAQADSCIGSKTSINFEDSKNLIGTFYPPDFIYIDSGFCRTLTEDYFNSGLGEIIKFHLMSDSKGYTLLKEYLSSSDLRDEGLLKKIILLTLGIKRSYFESDEFDSGRRNLLNYGHCFGHALESASNFKVCHGEAVIVGMGFANLLSLKRGIITKEKYDEFERIFRKHYPRFDLSTISVDALIGYLKRDKKRIGQDLTMILCEDIGKQIKADDIKESEIKDTFKEFAAKYKEN
ncbi:MAG: 3-dehydroquinate synthase [Candidatus Omnitrophica bacterium]|nr:3-dehydroquinate synthase [Candidatus Omnitrophota bacterium]MDD5430513.1 3-dehydroquinate synthase [Candidatus Omnitrophota bacterium]